MTRLFLGALLLLLAASPAQAERPWHYPQSASKAYVNPYLSPVRAARDWQARFEGQLVLWVGRANEVAPSGKQSLQLATAAGSVPVRFSRKVKNLQTDRSGDLVAVKGFVRRDSAGQVYLEGRSVIPWRPAGGYEPGRHVVEQWVDFSRPELTREVRRKISRAVLREAKAQKLDPLLLTALIQVESGFDPKAVSVSGARGLGQLMPFTARGLGVDATNIEGNVRGCSAMISRLVRRYAHRWDGHALALASYNAGPNLVARLQRVPSYEQTVNYVYFIGSLYKELKEQEFQRLQRRDS